MHDLVIVGAGPAGLATAYYLRDLALDVVILEAGPEVGGRTRSVSVGGVPSNTGALFVYRETPAETLAHELGVRTVPFVPATYGVHLNGTTVVDSDTGRLIDRLDLSPTARRQLREFIDSALTEYHAFTDQGRLTESASQLAHERFADRMVGLDPQVAQIITRAVQGGSVADPSRLSAQYALRYFASYLAHESGNRLYPIDGMQAIPRAMAAVLPDGTVRLGHRVTGVSDGPADHVLLELADGSTLRAREVLLAVPAPVTDRLVVDLPDWKRQSLAAAVTPGSTTLCVTADVTDLDELAQWSFVAVTGHPFDAIINPVPGDTRSGAGGRIAQFVCYGNSAGFRPDLVEGEAGREAWLEAFLTVAPQLRGRTLGAHLQTWEHCFAILTPERTSVLPQLRESVGRLHFAGDHTSETAGTHGAYTEARRVADLIRARRAA